MEKTYEIIPSTHRIVPCKIFSIALSKAVKVCSNKADPNVSALPAVYTQHGTRMR